MPVAINNIVISACARALSGTTKSAYFSEIQLEVEREAGPVGEGYLANAIESLGYTVEDSFQPWIVKK